MKYAFISGIPASGKSYLARKIEKETGIRHVDVDKWRDEVGNNPELKRWVDFFWNQNEKEYWRNTSCDQQWKNIEDQSEAFWPIILKKIEEIEKSGKGAIFEGVNILPHLARRDFDFEGIVLLGESSAKILERNKQNPRWGNTKELQILEAEAFWNCERPMYEQEARKYGFKTFSDSEEAEKELLRLLR